MAPIMAEATIVLHWTDGPLWRVNTEKKKEPNHEEVQLVSVGRTVGVCWGVGKAEDGGVKGVLVDWNKIGQKIGERSANDEI